MDQIGPAFEDVFRTTYASLVRTITPIVGTDGDAESIAQDAFLKAFVRWSRLRHYDDPLAWIRKVAVRDAVRATERNRRHRATPVPEALTHEANALAIIDVERALEHLTPHQRAATVLFHLADLSARDVADAVGCSEATVRVHLHRARKTLATLLGTSTEEITDGR